jgi:pimeloyl-ACP methyl ester carboxylesterase
VARLQTLTGADRAVVAHVCLNFDENEATAVMAGDTSFVGWADYADAGTFIEPDSSDRLFVMNFDHTLFPSSASGSYDNSNASAIRKQGAMLGSVIRRVLELTGREKVVLVGHSMGGLEIREYLQREEGGSRIWWADPTDGEAGHHVALVVTTGTPHTGSEYGAWGSTFALAEAVRDLRYIHYHNEMAPGLVQTPVDGIYLFGGPETDANPETPPGIPTPILYANRDINCDGDDGDTIVGVSQSFRDNPAMALPDNIRYVWIVSEDAATPGSDGVVEVDRQWLHETGDAVPAGAADTLMTSVHHVDEPADVPSLLRGLDEPDMMDGALPVAAGEADPAVAGIASGPQGGTESDVDWYRFEAVADGGGEFRFVDFSATGGWTVTVYSADAATVLAGPSTPADNPEMEPLSFTLPEGVGALVRIEFPGDVPEGIGYAFQVATGLETDNVAPGGAPLPARFEIAGVYPNPFNAVATVRLQLPAAAPVRAEIFDLAGRRVAVLAQRKMTAGRHELSFHGDGLASGLYLLRVRALESSRTAKLVLMK